MAKAPGELWRITGPTFTALLQYSRDHVWWAAPAIKQLERHKRVQVIAYCSSRGWKMERWAISDIADLSRGEYDYDWEEVRPTE